jgi:diguanylate cyclase (GGDEF)-like protein
VEKMSMDPETRALIEVQIITEISRSIATVRGLQPLEDVILNLMNEVVPSDFSCVFRWEEGKLRRERSRGLDGKCDEAVKRVEELIRSSRTVDTCALKDGTRFLVSKIFFGDRVLGALLFGRKEKEFSEREKRMAGVAAYKLAVAMAHNDLVKELERKAEDQKFFYELSKMVSKVEDLSSLYRVVSKSFRDLLRRYGYFNNSRVFAVIFGEGGELLGTFPRRNPLDDRNVLRSYEGGVLRKVRESGRELLLLERDAVLELTKELEGKVLFAYISPTAKVEAYVFTGVAEEVNVEGEFEKSLSLLLSVFAMVLENVYHTLFSEGRMVSDRLTELYTKEYFEKFLEIEFRKAERYSLPLSVLVLEVQKEGEELSDDSLLKELGERFKDSVRDADVVARDGGVFLFLFPQTDGEGGKVAAERLVSLVNNSVRYSEFKLRAFGGVAEFSMETNEYYDLLSKAYSNLLEAKTLGEGSVLLK